MALTTSQKLYAMYCIGAVESNWTWTSVNYNDPITLGMMQWYGTRAAGLLDMVRTQDADGYAMLADTLRASMDAHATTDTYWTSRYLTKTEGNSWVSAAERDENHAIQQNLFFSDLDGYESTLTGWGCATDTPEHVKSFIYYCSAYHQSPKRAGNVCAAIGGTASIDRIRAGLLNEPVLSQYKTRYNRVYEYLAAWDGTSDPPDFGQVDAPNTDPGGDSGSTIPQVTSQVHHIVLSGENLIVYGADNEGGLICYKGAGGYWYPQRNSAAPTTPTDPGNTPSGGAGSDLITQMQDLWRQNANKWTYSQGAGRLNPPTSGYSDCSGCIWWAVNTYDPEAAQRMGSATSTMLSASDNQGTTVAQGVRGEYPTPDQVHIGDLLVVNWNSTNIYSSGRHVEWVFPDYTLWGAGAAPLPHETGNIQTYLTSSWSPRSWRLIRAFS